MTPKKGLNLNIELILSCVELFNDEKYLENQANLASLSSIH